MSKVGRVFLPHLSPNAPAPTLAAAREALESPVLDDFPPLPTGPAPRPTGTSRFSRFTATKPVPGTSAPSVTSAEAATGKRAPAATRTETASPIAHAETEAGKPARVPRIVPVLPTALLNRIRPVTTPRAAPTERPMGRPAEGAAKKPVERLTDERLTTGSCGKTGAGSETDKRLTSGSRDKTGAGRGTDERVTTGSRDKTGHGSGSGETNSAAERRDGTRAAGSNKTAGRIGRMRPTVERRPFGPTISEPAAALRHGQPADLREVR